MRALSQKRRPTWRWSRRRGRPGLREPTCNGRVGTHVTEIPITVSEDARTSLGTPAHQHRQERPKSFARCPDDFRAPHRSERTPTSRYAPSCAASPVVEASQAAGRNSAAFRVASRLDSACGQRNISVAAMAWQTTSNLPSLVDAFVHKINSQPREPEPLAIPYASTATAEESKSESFNWITKRFFNTAR